MNYRYFVLTVVSTGVLLTGCYTPDGQPDRTATGALMGGAIGAGTGALIGNASGHHTAEGGGNWWRGRPIDRCAHRQFDGAAAPRGAAGASAANARAG